MLQHGRVQQCHKQYGKWEKRNAEGHVSDAHQDGIDSPTCITCPETDIRAKHHGDCRGGKTHRERYAGAINKLEHVASVRAGAEPELAFWRVQARQLAVGKVVDGKRIKRRQPGCCYGYCDKGKGPRRRSNHPGLVPVN